MPKELLLFITLILILTGCYFVLIGITMMPRFKKDNEMVEPHIRKMIYNLHDALPVLWFVALCIVFQQAIFAIIKN